MSESGSYLLRKARNDFDITQEDLAVATTLSPKTIRRAEKGKPISSTAATLICEYFSEQYHRQLKPEELGLTLQRRSKDIATLEPELIHQEKPINFPQKQTANIANLHDILNRDLSPPLNTYTGQLRETSIPSVLAMREFNTQIETKDWSVWVSLKLVQLLKSISSYKNGSSCEEICEQVQTMLDQEVKMLDSMIPHGETQNNYLLSRRQALTTIAALPTSLLSWKQPTPNDPILEELLPQCAASITACWHLLQGKGINAAEELLPAYVPSLITLAAYRSKYQRAAAELAVQANILQAIIAKHRLKDLARERHCLEAVRCSRYTGAPKLQAAALMTLGYTYLYCTPQRPERAVETLSEALRLLGSTDSLLRSDILIALADAYALCKEEKKALECIIQAQNNFPSHPELDPSFLYADCNLSVLYQWEGKMYLDLAAHYPDRGYYQKAWNAFEQIKTTQPLHVRNTSEVFIDQANAARGMGDLTLFTQYLKEGASMALEIGSQRRYLEALTVYQKTPEKWFTETAVLTLASDVFRGHLPGENKK